MKINYILSIIFISVIIYAGVDFETGITQTTRLNGQGCVCHNVTPDPSVSVWIEGPDTLSKGETAEYHIFLTGGPMVEGGFNVASRFSTLTATDPGTQILTGELTHNQPRPFVGDTVSWYFEYTAADSVDWDTLYSDANSVNGDGIPSDLDHWNFGINFPVRLLDVVPVEMIAFNALYSNGTVSLNWTTETEINNKGFEVQRSGDQMSEWKRIGFVQGKGTITEKSVYTFDDANPLNGRVRYRLKQLDFNGAYTYTQIAEVNAAPFNFALNQNYPNPFNPTTNIEFNVGQTSQVTLKVYDILGKETASLLNEYKNAGTYTVEFNASNLPSGIYICTLTAGNFTASKKLLLLK
ncbi:MAG TPA: T9SS type A sorting domain-containing protein [Ignavibacteriaceae bacterium]|nr:T9SS type A sorting domain-containing protein [Ignavibacteriaceae bacterium]